MLEDCFIIKLDIPLYPYSLDRYLETCQWEKKESGLLVHKCSLIKENSTETIKLEDTVKVHLEGKTAETGEKFDSSYDKGVPYDLPVNGVIPGFTEALLGKSPGDLLYVIIPPNLAYGCKMFRGQNLMFKIEIIDIVTPTN